MNIDKHHQNENQRVFKFRPRKLVITKFSNISQFSIPVINFPAIFFHVLELLYPFMFILYVKSYMF